MTRVSLKEAYDNKDVVAQIYAIRDIAEGAEDTADSAVTTANTASAHVDALVPQVEGAVQNANNASASAQASAQTVAGYENRLSAVEGETAGLDSDLNAVTLRVTTAEGQIVTIQGRVTALESADVQNVKLAGPQDITGIKTVPTEATGSRSQQIANSAKVGAELDNYAPMVRTTGNQGPIAGLKTFSSKIITPVAGYVWGGYPNATSYRKIATVNGTNCYVLVEVTDTSGKYAKFVVFFGDGSTPMVSLAISNASASGYTLSATYDTDNQSYDIYFKTSSGRSHVMKLESFNRFRDGVTMTLYPDSGDYNVATVPGQKTEVVVP